MKKIDLNNKNLIFFNMIFSNPGFFIPSVVGFSLLKFKIGPVWDSKGCLVYADSLDAEQTRWQRDFLGTLEQFWPVALPGATSESYRI